MGYYTRRWLYNLWCIICILIWLGIAFAFSFDMFGVILGGIIALVLFFIEIIVYAVKKGAQAAKPKVLICPRCKVKADPETGICPNCGTKL